MKKLSLLSLVLIVVLMWPVSGFAQEVERESPTMELFYAYTYSIDAKITISGSTVTCSGFIDPNSSSSTTSITVYLQRYEGGTWKTVTKWSGTSSAKGSYSITKGTYRARAEGKVYSSGKLVESPSKNSGSVTY